MGLCKCPQRKVSTLFCFKHHVNVCESCLVSDHPQCIVRSYLSWLQDNDYNPNCSLCQRSLAETNEETIRLLCYDLFHWSCLNEYFRSFPSHTAPDGYTCPTCNACVFPPPNLVSPVADQVRAKLATATWATRLSSGASDVSAPYQERSQPLTETEKNGYVIVNSAINGSSLQGTSGLSHHPHRTVDATLESTTLNMKSSDFDADVEDKYKRRSLWSWFARWLRSRQTSNRKGVLSVNRSEVSTTRFRVYMIFAVLFVFFTILTVLYHFTRGDLDQYSNRNEDPQFNPLNNPFIRVGRQLVNNGLKDSKSPENPPN